MFARVLLLCSLGLCWSLAQADTPIDEVRTLSTGAVPVASDPFTVSSAGTYTLTFTDLGTQLTPAAPLASVHVALTLGATVVGTLNAAGSTQVTLAAGSYVIRVTGDPGNNPGIFSASVTASGTAQPTFAFSSALSAAPSPTPSSVKLIQDTVPSLTVGSSYTAEIADLSFPQALSNLSLVLTPPGSSSIIVVGPGAPVPFTASTASYALFALGDAGTGKSGLYAIRIKSNGTLVYSRLVAIGAVSDLGATQSLATGTATVTSRDLAFPAPLASASVLLTQNTVEAYRSASPGAVAATLGGVYEVFSLASAVGAGGSGVAAIDVKDAAGAVAFTAARGVGVDANGVPLIAVYPVDIVNAGSYVASLTDLQFPATLTASSLAVAQAAALVDKRTGPGSLPVTLTAARSFLLVAASAPTGGSTLQQTTGLVSVKLAPASGAALFQTTQGVGAVFNSRSFLITTAGDYRFTLEDLAFPAPFTELAAIVTQDTTRLGLVFGQGSFDVLKATPGTYFINFLARPDATTKAGTYHLLATTKPADPTITLSSSPVAPASGAAFDLTWTSQNATSCTASSAWSGSKALSGTEHIAALTATLTYTLTCTGVGGSATQSLTVAPAQAASSGGGGSFDLLLLTGLGALGWRRRRTGSPRAA